MKRLEKFYQIHGSGIGQDGIERQIVVVGRKIEHNVMIDEKIDTRIMDDVSNNTIYKGVTTFQRKVRRKEFVMSYSICHPDDEFVLSRGVKIAKDRIKSNPKGLITTDSWGMLQDDMCMGIIAVELIHVAQNIDKYLPEE